MKELLKKQTQITSLSSTPSGTDAQKRSKEVDEIRRLIKESEDETRRLVLQAKTLLRGMYEASKKQPNVNKTIEDGLPVLEEIIESMAENRCSGFFAIYRLAERSLEKERAESSTRERSGSRKRAATSPPVSPTEKEIKKRKKKNSCVASEEWMQVQSKKNEKKEVKEKGRRKKRPGSQNHKIKRAPYSKKKNKSIGREKTRKAKLYAILLKPLEGNTYADVLSVVRKEIKPEELRVRTVRKTRACGVLLELRKVTANVRESFAEDLKKKAGGYCSQVKYMIDLEDLGPGLQHHGYGGTGGSKKELAKLRGVHRCEYVPHKHKRATGGNCDRLGRGRPNSVKHWTNYNQSGKMPDWAGQSSLKML